MKLISKSLSQYSSHIFMIDQSLFETSLCPAISLYLNGSITDVLSQDIIIQSMINQDFIHIDDIVNLFYSGSIPVICVIYLFIVNKRVNQSKDSLYSPHSYSDVSDYCKLKTAPDAFENIYNDVISNIDCIDPSIGTKLNTPSISMCQKYTDRARTCEPSLSMHDRPNIIPVSSDVCIDFDILNKNQNASTIKAHESVVNLSNRPLTPIDIDILQRGMKFCPTPGEADMSELHDDLDKLHVRLKRYLHFNKLSPPDDSTHIQDITLTPTPDLHEPFKHQKFKLPSDWIPHPIVNLENFIFKNHRDLSETKTPRIRNHNISKEERTALNQLAKDSSIVIKPADKGGAVVIWDRDKYIKEGLRQLSDNNFYIETESDLTSTHHREVVTLLDDMHSHGEIDISCHRYLTYTPIRTAQFYMLPKIHKDKINPPGRPIVSGNGCPTERIS